MFRSDVIQLFIVTESLVCKFNNTICVKKCANEYTIDNIDLMSVFVLLW